jgi:Amino acid permease
LARQVVNLGAGNDKGRREHDLVALLPTGGSGAGLFPSCSLPLPRLRSLRRFNSSLGKTRMNEAHAVMTEPSLRRCLGRWDLTAIGINQVIGGAVFLVPAQIAFLVGGWSPVVVLLIRLATLPVALCFAEAASRFEKTGGAYLYAKTAFGRN